MKTIIKWFTITSMIVLCWATLKVALALLGLNQLEVFSGWWWVAVVVIGAGSSEFWDRYMAEELAK